MSPYTTPMLPIALDVADFEVLARQVTTDFIQLVELTRSLPS
jgi:hypothetical protein